MAPELEHQEYAPLECIGPNCPICNEWYGLSTVETPLNFPEDMPSIIAGPNDGFETETEEYVNSSYTGPWATCDTGGEG